MRSHWMRILTFGAVLSIVVAPALLFLDVHRFAPRVLLIWLLMAAVFVLSRREP